jgi:hypothetical protein
MQETPELVKQRLDTTKTGTQSLKILNRYNRSGLLIIRIDCNSIMSNQSSKGLRIQIIQSRHPYDPLDVGPDPTKKSGNRRYD